MKFLDNRIREQAEAFLNDAINTQYVSNSYLFLLRFNIIFRDRFSSH